MNPLQNGNLMRKLFNFKSLQFKKNPKIKLKLKKLKFPTLVLVIKLPQQIVVIKMIFKWHT